MIERERLVHHLHDRCLDVNDSCRLSPINSHYIPEVWTCAAKSEKRDLQGKKIPPSDFVTTVSSVSSCPRLPNLAFNHIYISRFAFGVDAISLFGRVSAFNLDKESNDRIPYFTELSAAASYYVAGSARLFGCWKSFTRAPTHWWHGWWNHFTALSLIKCTKTFAQRAPKIKSLSSLLQKRLSSPSWPDEQDALLSGSIGKIKVRCLVHRDENNKLLPAWSRVTDLIRLLRLLDLWNFFCQCTRNSKNP